MEGDHGRDGHGVNQDDGGILMLKIVYDDQLDEVVDKVNAELRRLGVGEFKIVNTDVGIIEYQFQEQTNGETQSNHRPSSG